ncbi:hypothetical protein TPHA_0A03670 [Tetrapisispora phaffii CBS 4417]|uniref:General transcription and DNA repair factor IIH subunit TFB4 n=1 Tax=Tetrapisispora phaffii (strain ATCC 24235 / CBS 4417 / NBRC 1672 / NRRL Y-8282 / UCD 70-5) TaxID=1071381 RepID=G8BNG5_TETPH|nr:hypothetical protein TPHA_0A03670 [Tetrapisispora phaffii CBS 4417]CCE61443.1 hypothetical protein TPHA_0A03670 [Tetrapisispora phaffii CBS 4417]
MDAISDPAFQNTQIHSLNSDETPSLLTVIIDTSPRLWAELDGDMKEDGSIIKVLRSMLVFLNAHLATNNANKVAVIAAHSQGIKYLYPINTSHANKNKTNEISTSKKDLAIINPNMYRQFRNVDESLVEEIYKIFQKEKAEYLEKPKQKSTLAGAMSAGLTYINRIVKNEENYTLKSRLVVITCGGNAYTDNKVEEVIQYIPIMNCIFSATKMKCPIDVVKIGGSSESTFLQQATDATSGIYLYVKDYHGLIQYLLTAMFIEPSLRSTIVKPNSKSIDFRTSCYITGKVVAVGFICSICLCVMSILPPNNKCPACDSVFDEKVIVKLKRKPIIPGMVKKVTKNK